MNEIITQLLILFCLLTTMPKQRLWIGVWFLDINIHNIKSEIYPLSSRLHHSVFFKVKILFRVLWLIHHLLSSILFMWLDVSQYLWPKIIRVSLRISHCKSHDLTTKMKADDFVHIVWYIFYYILFILKYDLYLFSESEWCIIVAELLLYFVIVMIFYALFIVLKCYYYLK